MEGETQPRLSKRLQIVTLCPLLSGIIICTVIIISILFSNYLDWIKKTTDYIEKSEYENLEKLSYASSDLLSSKIRQMVFEMNMLKRMFEDEIELVDSGEEFISTENLYKDSVNKRDTKKSVWMSDNKDFTDFSEYGENITTKVAVSDIFMRTFMVLDRNISQIGLVLEDYSELPKGEILDYRYPQVDMTDIKKGTFTYNSTASKCKTKGVYSAICLDGYIDLKESHTITVYNEDDVMKVYLASDFGALVYYLPVDYFDHLFSDVEDYQFFFSTIDGKRTIRVFQHNSKAQNDTNNIRTVAESLFPTDSILQDEANKIFDKLSENSTVGNYSLDGFFSAFYGGISSMDVFFNSYDEKYDVYENNSMAVGSYIDQGVVYQDWNNVLDSVIDTIIIQMVIFLILLCITIATVWFLGMAITDKITHPIYLFEMYLRGKMSLQSMDRNYNQEVNQILSYLRMLETLERMIDPSFLQNAKLAVRESNLKEALKLFEDIKNRRGKAIIMNLLGNINYMKREFSQAVVYYKDSLQEMVELANEVKQQELDECGLSENEKTLLQKKAGKDSLSWESEKVFLNESIIDRKQQLCMGLLAELHESALELTEVRARLKEIYNYQHEILQYYASSRTQYLRLLKVMIDISGVFQELKYYHSGIELLDIVHDELRKLDIESGTEIDIDVTRLSRIGVNIKVDDEYNKRLHFIVKNVTFEKDILAQMMYYRRGLLLLENDKHYEAGLAFTHAIEKGQFFDPTIRKHSVKALHGLLEKFGLLKEAPDLIEMQNVLNSVEDSLMIVLAYDLYQYQNVSEDLINFVEGKLRKKWKIGAVTLNPNQNLKMKASQRDMADRDLEHLILSTKDESKKECIYDVILNAMNYYEEDSGNSKRTMLIVVCEVTANGFSTAEDLIMLAENGIKLYVLAKEGVLTGDEFLESMRRIGAMVVEFGGELTFKKALSIFYDHLRKSVDR